MVDLQLRGKLCLVTGGSYGIGSAIVKDFLSQKARVIVVARNAINQPHQDCYFYSCDLLDVAARQAFLKQVLSTYGAPDIVVHNLGGSLKITEDFASVEEWQRVWQLNVGVSIDINNNLIPKMIEDKKNSVIVHVSSSATKTYGGYASYISAKAALNSYIKMMALRYSQYGLRINGVAPGAIKLPGRYFAELEKKSSVVLTDFLTQHVAMRRLGLPEEVAQAIMFLASPMASYITGTILEIDGGMR